ncbi:MAG: biotin transporter BioY [Planctomycetota bacterium]|nr:biotin transporter BioY [Planctomycetota bacterium]
MLWSSSAPQRGITHPRADTIALPARSRAEPSSALRDLLAASFFALFTSIAAQIAIPLPPDYVPMSLQTLAVLLAALCLGPRVGTLSMLIYLAVGVGGGAVFAEGSKGLAVLVGQTGGYLLGFVCCQPVVGMIARRRDGSVRGWLAMIAAVLAGNAVVFAFGVPVLGLVNGYGVGRALEGGLYPYLPGLVVKSVAAVMIGRLAAPLAARRPW